jgi:glycerol-3-phosphate dehydrogenase
MISHAFPRREERLQRLRGHPRWDMVVIGAGIIGAAVAREALRCGARSVLVLEQRDFAWGTSSRSSKMVHGGLRYIVSGDWRITRDSVRERQRLLAEVPGLVDPLWYLFPARKGVFPGRWAFTAVLGIYDLFARKQQHRFLSNAALAAQAPGWAPSGLRGASRYLDAVTDDARLVQRLLNEAQNSGALLMNYMRVESLLRDGARVGGVRVRDLLDAGTFEIEAAVVISATGAWADELRSVAGGEAVIRPLRGSHIVLPGWRLPVAQSITFPHPRDRRPVFIFPWEGRTLVGTTDLDHRQTLDEEPSISAPEMDYLLAGIADQFPSSGIGEDDIIATFAGVRPVIGTGMLNPSKERRDHSVWNDNGLVTVSGGKLTTFRPIAWDALAEARKQLPALREPDPRQPIFDPGITGGRPQHVGELRWRRLCGRYGADAARWMAAQPAATLQPVPGTSTLWVELCWAANEHVEHLEDLLLRRTRLGILCVQGALPLLPRIRELTARYLQWSDERWQEEQARYASLWRKCYSVPAARET